MSPWSMTWSSHDAGGLRNMQMSCPCWRRTSVSARDSMPVIPMLVTCTSVSLRSPHSRMKTLLNQSSKAGTKWFH